MVIQPGRYRIRNAASGTYFDNSLGPRHVIHGWTGNPKLKNQQWEVTPASQGRYCLRNVDSGLHVLVNRFRDGVPVEAAGRPTEWRFVPQADAIAIHAENTPFVIDLDMGRPDKGTPINIWGWHNARQQLWYFEPVRQGDDQQGQQQQVYQGPLQAGDYNIRNSYAGTALDLSEASPEDCTPIIGYHVNNAPNQSWRLISRATGYVLQNVATDTYLGFPLGERPQDGVLISGNQNSVEWKITQGKYGYQIHLADKSNLVLELIDGFDDNYPVDGAKVCLRSNKSGKSQFWQISPV